MNGNERQSVTLTPFFVTFVSFVPLCLRMMPVRLR